MTARHDSGTGAAAGNLLAAALRYAGGGISVFPLNGKAPLTEHGFHDATTDREQIEAWWARHPTAGIGTPDFDVVDVDLYKPECGPTWAQIKPLIPEGTACTKTGAGGLQYLFAAGSLRDGKIGPGVDSRYAGRNYVVLPPSPHPSGTRYEAVVDVLLRRPKPAPEFPYESNGGGTAVEIAKKISTGEKIVSDRNTSTFWTAVRVIEAVPGVPLEHVEQFAQAWVRAHCAGNLDEIDVAKQVRGAAKYVAGKHPEGISPAAAPSRLTLVPLSKIEARSIVFLDKPLWQRTGFHLVVGRKGVGKGTDLAGLASLFTRGELGDKRQVIWISSDDSAAIDIKPRVMAAGGDPERIYIVQDWVQFPRDLDAIREAIVETGDVGLVIVDPVGNHITGKNSNAETDIRDAIAPLNHLSDELETLLVGVRHLSEKEASCGVLAAILGSSAWVQVPRAVVAIVRDSEDPSVSHIQCVAGNRLPPGTPGRMFRIEGVILPGLENEVTRAVALGDSTRDVETMLSAKDALPKSENARELLLDILDAEGDQESDALDARVARETGLAARTVKNARTALRDEGLIRAFPDKDENGAVTRWNVGRTLAPRDSGKPESLAPPVGGRNGLTTPESLQSPTHNLKDSGYQSPRTVGKNSGGILAGEESPSAVEVAALFDARYPPKKRES